LGSSRFFATREGLGLGLSGGLTVNYRFGAFSLEANRRELRCGADAVRVEPQVFDLLLYLLRNRDHVVSKDELIQAVWEGRIVSDSALSSGVAAARQAIGDSGEQQRLIRTISRRGFRFIGDVMEEVNFAKRVRPARDPVLTGMPPIAGSGPEATLRLPHKPSIAVLPFQNLSGDSEQEYFADGIVEDITSALSRIRWLFVIARNSSFTYKGRVVDVKQVGSELGVRYVLQGGIRKATDRIRITGHLIDATTGAHLWAERFEGSLEDVFTLQDQLTASVVGSIAPRIEQAEIERAKNRQTESLDAYDCFLRGMASFYRRDKEETDDALRLFYRAIEIDSDFPAALGMAAWCYAWRKMNGWLADREREIAEGRQLARRAVHLGKDDTVALARGGHALAFLGHELDTGLLFIERALAIDPNHAPAWFLSGWLQAFRGEPETALEQHATAMRLSPLDPTLYHMQIGTAFANMMLGDFEFAVSWAMKAFRQEPEYLPAAAIAAASCALAGRAGDAHEAMVRVRQLDPGLRISNVREWYPVRRDKDFDRFVEGLRKAGLPK
jgi:TolB-like protein